MILYELNDIPRCTKKGELAEGSKVLLQTFARLDITAKSFVKLTQHIDMPSTKISEHFLSPHENEQNCIKYTREPQKGKNSGFGTGAF
ncbi:MAG: hypothetical protein A3C93_04815 [Candidatus Lloydbacteria bacterium RIFCSPHIGHO2_02_FULL_54_17]|uniref:Uncharacterized protein n=1 Tax=Candidatus Lloydbacteria bacterium RIFCSPHIGHO2_02_FULL_54_17 TaxID=1798664 RepID=A0A1G2DHX3_9BACT|nr:MAG: hypothetical protein A2762_01725 [Candidatus Lloydbacteria bacterium RIFCSPHIGHO2_01_FULL_54_11]OGZ12470.1 MAG: hypothetical protein A3C93_04815 [Candidatus Lloydbacteria bacterium RIFCSPHIGHO2_02_FULL_54_17]OGZ14728.1 MAG: hypothetical protein A2948_04495 [Candidatus Lloydbacteria bacterium RIFCSPLOWO2_01_FULL_54_18]